jgi:hypothetical protein
MLALKFIQTRFRQSFINGPQPFSHATNLTQRYGKRPKTTTVCRPSTLRPQKKKLSNPRQTVSRRRSRKSRNISTLNQHKLLPSDFLSHLSNRSRPVVQLLNATKDKLKDPQWKLAGIQPVCHWQFGYHDMHGKPFPFPPNSSGFLYYYQPQDAPLLAGELRFRLTPNNLPQSFSQGEDCLTPDEDIWKIPLLVLYRYKAHQNIYRQLQLDGFVSDGLHSKLKTVVKSSSCPRHSGIILHSLHQVFPVNFAASNLSLFVVGDSTYRRVGFHCPFEIQVSGYKKGPPFTSAAELFLEKITSRN